MKTIMNALQRDLVQYGLTASGLKNRMMNASSPKIIANSMPKAGTNLLLRVLYLTPFLHRKFTRTINNCSREILINKLENFRKGEIAAAHLFYSQEREALFQSMGFKHVFMIRDPRDIVTSSFVYITYKDKRHRLHQYFKNSLKTDSDRLFATIRGVDASILPDGERALSIGEHLEQYLPWISSNSCMFVRFEDLVGSRGGGDDEKQFDSLRRIYQFLDIQGDPKSIKILSKKIFDSGSRTFFKGQIGGWREYFTKEHRLEFKEIAGQALIKMGYETGLDW